MDAQVNFQDVETGERETMFFFLFDAFLKSRMETNLGSDGDEEVNMYMAHLLLSMVDGRLLSEHADRLALIPADVFLKAEHGDNPRRKLEVYRTNADHRLAYYCVFSGTGEHQSLYRQQFTLPESYLEEAQIFYRRACLAGYRLSSRYQGLVLALAKISEHFETYRTILTHMSANYLRLHPCLTTGQLFHLEREANQAAQPGIEKIALDKMLDAYNAWQANPTIESEAKYRQACEQYRQINPAFDPNQPWDK